MHVAEVTLRDFGQIHEHNVYFYSDILKKHEILFTNLKNGLNNRCQILYIASGESILSAKSIMAYYGLFKKSKEPKIVTCREWFTPDGKFDPDRVKGQYLRLLDDCLDRGFEGLYVSGDAADIFDYLKDDLKSWLKFEASIGKTINAPIEAICSYPVDQVKHRNEELLQLIQAHKKTITPETSTVIDNQKLCVAEELSFKDLHKKLELDAPRYF